MTDFQIVTADDPGVLSLGSHPHMADYGAVIASWYESRRSVAASSSTTASCPATSAGAKYVTVEGLEQTLDNGKRHAGRDDRGQTGVREPDGDYEAEVERIRQSDGAGSDAPPRSWVATKTWSRRSRPALDSRHARTPERRSARAVLDRQAGQV